MNRQVEVMRVVEMDESNERSYGAKVGDNMDRLV